MRTKKGQSLVEVIVALGIITLVFAGAITLIVNAVNLEISARNRTEATALAQRELALALQAVGEGCEKGTYEKTLTESWEGATYNIKVNTIGIDENDLKTEKDFTSSDFAKITVTVSWKDKNLPEETYQLSQIVRK